MMNIDELRAELNKQVALVEKCMVAMNENADRGQRAEAERDTLQAEVERLNAALRLSKSSDAAWKQGYEQSQARLTALEDRLYTVYAALGDALFELKVGNTYTTATDSYKANNELIHRLDIVMNGQYVSRTLAAGAAPTKEQT